MSSIYDYCYFSRLKKKDSSIELNNITQPCLLHDEGDISYFPKFFAEQFDTLPEIVRWNVFKNYKAIAEPELKIYQPLFDKPLYCKYEPKEHQKDVVEQFFNIYNKNGGYINGILNLTTGFGKTFLSLYLANILRHRTLIIVDNTTLLTQWYERIREYFPDIKDDEVIIYKKRRNKKKDIIPDNCRFIITYIQSLNSIFRMNDIEEAKYLQSKNIGMLIYDESHAMSSSKEYAKASSLFDTRNVIGITATVGLNRISLTYLHTSIGKVIIQKKYYDYKPKLYFVSFNMLEGMDYKKQSRYLRQISFASNNNRIQNVWAKYSLYSDIYLDKIKEIVDELLKNNHKVLIVCTTIDQCNMISTKLGGIPQIHSKSSDPKNSSNVIVGTYKSCSKGFDRKDLSAIIIASPYYGRISLIQMIGRILRKTNDKQDPVVIYMDDISLRDYIDKNEIISKLIEEYGDIDVNYFNEYQTFKISN